MNKIMRILMVEDSPVDSEIITHRLSKAAFHFESIRVSTEINYLEALDKFNPSIILADYQLPEFDGLRALRIVREKQPDLPFIFVTGTMGEDAAVKSLHEGASDYILKDRLHRLPEAILKALHDGEQKRRLKAAETQLRESESRFRGLVEASLDWIWQVDANMCYTYVSPRVEQLLGISSESLIGKSLQSIVAASDQSIFSQEINHYTSQQLPFYLIEKKVHGKSGKLLTLETSGSPILNLDGKLLGYNGIDRDISEKKELQKVVERYRNHLENLVEERTRQLESAVKKAEEASRAKQVFLANMSHEIRTPMNAILGMTHLLRQSPVSSEQDEKLRKVELSSKLLLQIINDILDITKIETGKLELESIPISILGILDNLQTLVSEEIEKKQLKLSINTENIPENLVGDPTRLMQALVNYINNAVKFTDRGSVTINVETLFNDNSSCTLKFSVTDTGIGLGPAEQKQLFKLFSQADPSTTRHYGGSGLGLFITKQLTELMGGKCGVESIPGKGSTFWFTAAFKHHELPPDAESKQLVSAEQARQQLLTMSPDIKILLVEDEPTNREVAIGLLNDVGISAASADNGKEAVMQVASGEMFDLILMDMMMPLLDGVEATKQIRCLENGRTVPIIAMTANVFKEDREICHDAGMQDFLAKPVEPQALYELLFKWIASNRSFSIKDPASLSEAASSLTNKSSSGNCCWEKLLKDHSIFDLSFIEKVFNNDTILFRKMIKDFLIRYSSIDKPIIASIEAEEQTEAVQLIHRLNGVAGTLGLKALHATAKSIESMLRKDKTDKLILQNLLTQLNSDFSNITSLSSDF